VARGFTAKSGTGKEEWNMYVALAGLIVALNIVDLLQTRSFILDYGAEGEANVLVRMVYKRWKFQGIIVFKSLLIGFAIGVGLLAHSTWLMLTLTGIYIFAVVYNSYVMRYNARMLEEEER
jgi:hypothetical protein